MGYPGGHRRARQRRSSLPLPGAALVRRRRRFALSFSEVGPRGSGHAAEQRPPSNNKSAGLLGGRFNNSSTIRCMVPGHGSSLKPPPDTTPDDAGDPARVVVCLDGPSE